MLSEVISSEELLSLVALAEFVDLVQMFSANVPLRRVGELLAAEATDICATGARLVKRRFWSGKCGARPRVLAEV